MADDKPDNEPTLVERWLADQQAWQQTALTYLDSMVNNDEFLVHLGNAMRGSLLAGKPYPTAPASDAAEPATEADARLDEILHALHLIQGELRDLRSAVDGLQRQPAATEAAGSSATADRGAAEPGRAKATARRPAKSRRAAKTSRAAAATRQPAAVPEGTDGEPTADSAKGGDAD